MSVSQTAPAFEIERRQQIDAARQMAATEEPRRTLSVNRSADTSFQPRSGNERRVKPVSPRAPLQGHAAFLKALEFSNADVVLEKVSSGNIYHGKIKHSDKFTLTMRVTVILRAFDGVVEHPDPHDRVIFKSDISEFYTTTVRTEGQRA